MIERIEGTRFRTNVKTGDIQTDSWFGMLDKVELTSHPKSGKLIKLTVTVSEWLANAVQNRDLNRPISTALAHHFVLKQSRAKQSSRYGSVVGPRGADVGTIAQAKRLRDRSFR